MPPLLLWLWREQHPGGHEQTTLNFKVRGPAAELVLLFEHEVPEECNEPIPHFRQLDWRQLDDLAYTSQIPMNEQPQYVLTLVHGTFAPGAAWTQEGSMLREVLSRGLGHSVVFEVFSWTGANDHETRITESQNLRLFLEQTIKTHPGKRHYIIAHSHGGNLVVRALQDEQLAAQISGVLTMGTPFLHSIPRKTDLALMILKCTIPLILLVVLTLGVVFLITHYKDDSLFGLSANASKLVGQLLYILGLISHTFLSKKAFRYVDGPLKRKLVNNQTALGERMNLQGVATPFLCAVISGDEARGWLLFVRWGSNLFFSLFRLFAAPLGLLWFFCMVGFWLLFLSIQTESAVPEQSFTQIMTWLAVGLVGSWMLLIPIIVVPNALRARRWGFGGESVLDNSFSDIRISLVPQNTRCSIYVAPQKWRLVHSVLRHSTFYGDPLFLGFAATWIEGISLGTKIDPPTNVLDFIPNATTAAKPHIFPRAVFRTNVFIFIGCLAWIYYLGIVQAPPPQHSLRSHFPRVAWWTSPAERNVDLQPGLSRENLSAVHFSSETEGWVGGPTKALMHTRDGGITWNTVHIAAFGRVHSLTFVSTKNAWGLSDEGELLRTRNGGENWYVTLPEKGLEAITFVTPSIGWGVGKKGIIVRSADGGASWTRQQSGTNATLFHVEFRTAHDGWIAGENGTLLKTDDGGLHWIQLKSGVTVALRSVTAPSAQQALAVGDRGTVLESHDGGVTWNKEFTDTFLNLNSIAVTSGVDVAVGQFGEILRHTSDQISWRSIPVKTSQNLCDLTLQRDGQGWAVGDQGTILHTQDNGASWQSITSDAENEYLGIATTSDLGAWIVGSGGVILHTTDGGTTWKKSFIDTRAKDVSMSDSYTPYTRFDDLAFQSEQFGWVVGALGKVLHTSDGGNSWVPQVSPTLEHLYGVAFATPHNGWAVGSSGTLIATEDGGEHWVLKTAGTTSDLYDVQTVDPSRLWAVGEHGTIIRSLDGGQTWERQESGVVSALYEVYFSSPLQGNIVGDENTILHTEDGGLTWRNVANKEGGQDPILSIAIPDPDRGWAVGPAKTIYDAFEGGRVWGMSWGNAKDLKAQLNSIRFVNKNVGWIVGRERGIYRTTDGTGHWDKQGYSTAPGPWFYVAAAALTMLFGFITWMCSEPAVSRESESYRDSKRILTLRQLNVLQNAKRPTRRLHRVRLHVLNYLINNRRKMMILWGLHLAGLVICLIIAFWFNVRQLSLWPNGAIMLHHKGAKLADSGRYSAAISEFREALSIEPRYTDAQADLAAALRKSGANVEAEVAWRNAIYLEPENKVSHNNHAMTLVSLGEYERAVQEMRNLVSQEPDNATYRGNLAIALEHIDKKQAIAEYQEILKRNPSDVTARLLIEELNKEIEDYDPVERRLRHALSKNPNDVKSLADLGGILSLEGKENAALVIYKTMIQVDPGFAKSHLPKGVLAEVEGDFSAAVADFEADLAQAPSNHGIQVHLNCARALRDHTGLLE